MRFGSIHSGLKQALGTRVLNIAYCPGAAGHYEDQDAGGIRSPADQPLPPFEARVGADDTGLCEHYPAQQSCQKVIPDGTAEGEETLALQPEALSDRSHQAVDRRALLCSAGKIHAAQQRAHFVTAR